MKHIALFSVFLLLFSSFDFSQGNKKVSFTIKLFLQGPYKNNSMSNELDKENLIPLFQPYNAAPWRYNGNEHVKKIPEGIVDWILIELTKDNKRSQVVARKAGFLKVDGEVTSLDGSSPLTFENITNEKCYLVIEHRNHLPVMSRNPILLNNSINYDFTVDQESALGNSLTDLGNGIFGLISGDSDSNGEINNQDFKVIASNLLKVGYLNADLDMNGVVNVLDYKKTNINISKKTAFR